MWTAEVDGWLDAYTESLGGGGIHAVVLGAAAFLFDIRLERVVLAFAVSTPQLQARDTARMRGFPDVNVGVRVVLGSDAKLYDRGHFLGHASGGELDMNLFPHLRALNRGWSREGKAFRRLERAAAEPGTFFFHRPLYSDDSWIPAALEYGVLLDSTGWSRDSFSNR